MSMRHHITGCRITATCLQFGCDIRTTGVSANLYHEKQEHPFSKTKVRRYYKGELRYCGRQKCDWQEFIGDANPTRVVDVLPDGREVTRAQ